MVSLVKKYLLFVVGVLMLGFGISLSLKVGLGGDPLGVLYDGFSKFFNVSPSVSSIIISTIFVLVTFFIDKKEIGIGTLISVLFLSVGISLGNVIIPEIMNDYIRYFLIFLILLIYSFSIAFMIKANIGKSAYDSFIFTFRMKFKKTYAQMKFIIDAVCLFLGILFGGTFNICTLVLLIFCGKGTELVLEFLNKN